VNSWITWYSERLDIWIKKKGLGILGKKAMWMASIESPVNVMCLNLSRVHGKALIDIWTDDWLGQVMHVMGAAQGHGAGMSGRQAPPAPAFVRATQSSHWTMLNFNCPGQDAKVYRSRAHTQEMTKNSINLPRSTDVWEIRVWPTIFILISLCS